MEESFLFLLLSYALTPALSQRERELPTNSLAHWVRAQWDDVKAKSTKH